MVQENTFRLVGVSFFRLSGCTCWEISDALLTCTPKEFSVALAIYNEKIEKKTINFYRK